jgi:hypothetical protein
MEVSTVYRPLFPYLLATAYPTLVARGGNRPASVTREGSSPGYSPSDLLSIFPHTGKAGHNAISRMGAHLPSAACLRAAGGDFVYAIAMDGIKSGGVGCGSRGKRRTASAPWRPCKPRYITVSVTSLSQNSPTDSGEEAIFGVFVAFPPYISLIF